MDHIPPVRFKKCVCQKLKNNMIFYHSYFMDSIVLFLYCIVLYCIVLYCTILWFHFHAFWYFLIVGCVRLRKIWGDGCISQVVNRVKQVFQLVHAPSFESQEESRFQYFKESVLNQVLRMNQSHTLIVTPSYLSFIRVRNELLRREVNDYGTLLLKFHSFSQYWKYTRKAIQLRLFILSFLLLISYIVFIYVETFFWSTYVFANSSHTFNYFLPLFLSIFFTQSISLPPSLGTFLS